MRIAVLSDIHGNHIALQAVLEHAGPVDGLWSLGDVVGYGPDPNACIQTLAARPHVGIVGNHDWAVLGRLDLAEFNNDARRANLWTRKQLLDSALAYLTALPETLEVEGYTLAHGSPRSPIWEYLIYANVAQASFAHFGTPVCFVGHTHVPVIFHSPADGSHCVGLRPMEDEPLALTDGRYIVNPGSVGQPRDGDPRAAYCLLDTETRTVTWRRVAYDIAVTQERMRAERLPKRSIERLEVGW